MKNKNEVKIPISLKSIDLDSFDKHIKEWMDIFLKEKGKLPFETFGSLMERLDMTTIGPARYVTIDVGNCSSACITDVKKVEEGNYVVTVETSDEDAISVLLLGQLGKFYPRMLGHREGNIPSKIVDRVVALDFIVDNIDDHREYLKKSNTRRAYIQKLLED